MTTITPPLTTPLTSALKTQSNERIKTFAALLVLLLTTLFFDLLFFSYTLEDAQITYRYALRFSQGYEFGLWNRTGNPVEGFTTFLWMLYLSAFGPNLESIIYASKFTSTLAHLSLTGLLFALSLKFRGDKLLQNSTSINPFNGYETVASNAFAFSSIAVACFLPLAWYATSGMETMLFIALTSYVILLPLLTSNLLLLSLLTMLLVLTRPDGIMFALASPLYYGIISKDRRFIVIALVAIASFIALTVFRYIYFGHLMPNTYYAKAVNAAGFRHIKFGILYFAYYFSNHIYLFIPIFALFIKSLVRKQWFDNHFALLMFSGITVYFAIIAKAGGDNFSAFPQWRHVLNVLPLLLFTTFYSIFTLSKKQPKRFSAMVLILLFVGPVLGSYPQVQSQFLQTQLSNSLKTFPNLTNEHSNNPLLLWLKQISDENTVIATSLAGALPLTIDAQHIDVLGLNDEYIAHHGTFDPVGPLDSKTDMAYVVAQRPDIIEGYISAKEVLHNEHLEEVIIHRRKMNMEMLAEPIFQNEYLVINNAPYDSFDRILYIHQSFYQKLLDDPAVDIQAHPVDALVAAAASLNFR